jgi:hypothetical protein
MSSASKTLLMWAPVFLSTCAFAQWDDSLLKPFVIDHRAATTSPADLAFLHDAPAGKGGFIRIQGGHFVKPDGKRIRFWGVHLTDWSPGSIELPAKEDTPMWARSLARYGVNMVRLHFVDKWAPTGITDGSKDDTRSFDAQQLDRLDFLVSELKKNGIYMDLNLNVGRAYKEGDGVPDAARLQWAKGLTLYDKRIIELEKEYAHNLLTHLNPYTKTEYRNEPAIAIVEILNENGIGFGHNPPSKFYADELDGIYNTWLKANLTPDQLQKIREEAGVQGDAPIPRLRGNERATAPKDRYETDVRFYMALEDGFYQDMTKYLRDLGLKQPIIGTADHGHSGQPWTMLANLSRLDILDGHIYWNSYVGVGNVPMVNDPLHSMPVQVSRTAFAGKPYTVSETDEPFPNEYGAEAMPIMAAYAGFQDWDMVVWYTFEPKKDPNWKPFMQEAWDISHDPTRMTAFAAGALMFLQGDVKPALQTIERTYSKEQVLDAGLLPAGGRGQPAGAPSEVPYFTPGFPLALPLEHGVRIQSFDGAPTARYTGSNANPIVSDTKELSWYLSDEKTGVVTVDTDRAQALIGFLKANKKTLKNLSADITNNFATIVLESMDGKPIARSGKMFLNTGSRSQNTDEKWNEGHTALAGVGRRGGAAAGGGPPVAPVANPNGHAPTLIEPVNGTVTLRNLQGAKAVSAVALDGSGAPIGEPLQAKKTAQGWDLSIGTLVTPWYVVSVRR